MVDVDDIAAHRRTHGPSAICVSVTLVHPTKAVGRNKMPFGRDTRVVTSNTDLDRGPGLPTGRGDFGVGTPDLYSENEPADRARQCRLMLNLRLGMGLGKEEVKEKGRGEKTGGERGRNAGEGI